MARNFGGRSSVTKDHSILVTGGGGYIGSHVVLALREAGHSVVVVDDLSTGRRAAVPDDVALVVGDVADADCISAILARHSVDAVMHFAGSVRVEESVADPLKYYRNNASASRTLIETCVAGGVARFVFSSTAAAYGMPDGGPVDETTRLAPINPYGHSKVMTEQVLRDTGAATGLNYAILRYFNVAGADPAGRTGQATPNATHLIKVACEVATGARRGMEIFGTDYDTPDGTCVRDYIHVSDLADAHVRVLDWLTAGARDGTFNCGYGRGYSVREVLDAVEKVTGRKLAVTITGRRAGDSPALVADSTLIRRETGWTPRHDDLETIVRTALEWERKLVAV
jgi:UDP-glucose 4-epimerase